MDPVVGTIVVAIVGSALSGAALIRSSRTSSTASEIQTLVTGQQAALVRLDGLVAAKDSIIDDLREDLSKCHHEREVLSTEVERQGAALAQAEKAIERQAKELNRLRARVTELGDERLP